MHKEKLHKKWLADELTAKELKEFESQTDAPLSKKIVAEASRFKSNATLNDLDFDALKSEMSRIQTPPQSFKKYAFAIAAILVIALGVFTLWNQNDTTITTSRGVTNTITLPDQSIVTLNAESSLTYNEKSWDDNRVIALNGEAFFEVEKGSTFTVHTDQGIVQVIGTKFNVQSREEIFEVRCFEGKVKVENEVLNELLIKNEQVRLFNNKRTKTNFKQESPTWMQEESSFYNVPLHLVFKELERQYDIKLTIKNTAPDRVFTGSFTHKNINEALAGITKPMQLKYTIVSSKEVQIYE